MYDLGQEEGPQVSHNFRLSNFKVLNKISLLVGELIMSDKEDKVFEVYPQTLIVIVEILNFQFHEYVQYLDLSTSDISMTNGLIHANVTLRESAIKQSAWAL